MHGRTKRLTHRTIGTNQQIGTGFHRSTANDRLAGLLKVRWQVRTAGAERPGRSLAVYEQLPFGIALDFSNVVRHVVDQLHAQLFGRFPEHVRERFTDLMSDHLAIGERRVGGAIHRREIVLPFD